MTTSVPRPSLLASITSPRTTAFTPDGVPPDSAGLGPLDNLVRQLVPFRRMRARLAIEPAIAREALQEMRRAVARSKAATTLNEYASRDTRCHPSVAEARDTPLLLPLFDPLNDMRRAVAWGNVTRET